MRPAHLSAAMPARLWRVVAALAAGMVMLLALTNVSPELHAWLHENAQPDASHVCPHHAAHSTSNSASHVPSSTDDDTHQCAITLFSQGVVHHAATLLAQPCEGILRAIDYRAFERLA